MFSVANNIWPSKSAGSKGFKSEAPSTTLKFPSLVKKSLSILFKWKEKSVVISELNSGISIVLLPVPLKLFSKSEPEVAPGNVEASSTLGLKSKLSLNSKLFLKFLKYN